LPWARVSAIARPLRQVLSGHPAHNTERGDGVDDEACSSRGACKHVEIQRLPRIVAARVQLLPEAALDAQQVVAAICAVDHKQQRVRQEERPRERLLAYGCRIRALRNVSRNPGARPHGDTACSSTAARQQHCGQHPPRRRPAQRARRARKRCRRQCSRPPRRSCSRRAPAAAVAPRAAPRTKTAPASSAPPSRPPVTPPARSSPPRKGV